MSLEELIQQREEKKARVAIAAELSKDFNVEIAESKGQRSFSNKKNRLIKKTNRCTGNVQPSFSEDEKEFEKSLQGEDPLQSKTVRKLYFGEPSSTHSTEADVED